MGKTTKQKLAGIYDPYIDTLGGGEKYMFTLAQTLLESGYRVDVFTDHGQTVIDKLQTRFNLNLKKISLKPDIFKQSGLGSVIKKYRTTKNYDLFVYLNDGSIPFIFSKKNILHVQVPFNKIPGPSQKFLNTIKLSFYKKIIVNSKFTQARTKRLYGKKSDILYPPIDITNLKPSAQKQNIILSVGRFDNILNSKKQDVLIEAFKFLYQQNNLTEWRLILAGASIDIESKNQYLSHLKYMAKNLPIEFIVNSPFDTIKRLYSISKIYWHAAGFGVDERINPQSVEHFGMTAIEAMSAGLVPMVVDKGGLKEIIKHGHSGYLWDKKAKLISKTQFLIGHPEKLNQMSKIAQNKARQFSTDRFKKAFLNIIK